VIVAHAVDGVAALERIQASPRPFDLVVTDVRMPRMDGLALARALQVISPSTDILIISAFPIVDTLAEPAPRFLEKPFSNDVFLQVVQPMLDARL
jgi:two-component system, NtrC family, response regulator HydG